MGSILTRNEPPEDRDPTAWYSPKEDEGEEEGEEEKEE